MFARAALCALLVLLFSVSSLWAAETLDSTQLWEKYRTELFKFLRAGDKTAMPGLQLVTTPFPAEWDRNPEYLQEICARMPKWGISWQMGSRRFQDEYYGFLTNLNLPSPKSFDDAKLLQMEERVFEIEMKIEAQTEKCAQQFVTRQDGALAKYLKSYTWEQYKSRFCFTVLRLEDELIQVRAAAELEKVKGYGKYWDARAALGKFAATPEDERVFYALGELARFAEDAERGFTSGFEIKITSKTKIDEQSTTQMGFGVGFSGAFFGVPIGVKLNYEKKEMKFKTSTDEFQLIIGAKGYRAIPVFPKRTWFSPSVVEDFRNGPFRDPTKKYFGDLANKSSFENARMALVPKTLFVVVAPQVEMFVSREDAEQIEKASSFGVSINVAGLDFSFNKGATFKKSTESAKLTKITITGDSKAPQLLAVDNYILPNFS